MGGSALLMPSAQLRAVALRQHNAGKPFSIFSSKGLNRFEVRSGDHWPLDVKGDGGKTERERSELYEPPVPPDTPMTAQFDLTVEKGVPTSSPWTVLAQVHQVDYPGQQTKTVPFLMGLETGDRLFVRATVNPENSFQSFRDVVLWHSARPLRRGRVYRVAISLRMDVRSGGKGALSVSIDGKQIVRYAGPIGMVGTSGYYWKHGIYRAQAPETIVVTFRNGCFGGPQCLGN